VGDGLTVCLVRSCKNLVALCLVDYFDPSFTEMATKQLTEEILPIQPTFWFYVDEKLPKSSQVPGLYYDDIVDSSSYLLNLPFLYLQVI
jgi:hypothetical protein